MLAYVERVQKKEKKHNVSQLTHQRWSGANFTDALLTIINPDNAELSSSSHDSTENQFSSNGKDIAMEQLREGL